MMQNKKTYIPVFGITGGVGSGKSVVMKILSEDYHAGIIMADDVGHDLMKPGAVSYRQIVRRFGKDILSPDGQINRKALSSLVFQNEEKLVELNQITHPNIRKEILRRINAYREETCVPFIALEAALLIEGGYEKITDEMWYIYVTEENRIKRLMEGRGYTEGKSRSVMASQLPEKVFRRHCRIVIDNNGTVDETRVSVRKALIDCGLDIS